MLLLLLLLLWHNALTPSHAVEQRSSVLNISNGDLVCLLDVNATQQSWCLMRGDVCVCTKEPRKKGSRTSSTTCFQLSKMSVVAANWIVLIRLHHTQHTDTLTRAHRMLSKTISWTKVNLLPKKIHVSTVFFVVKWIFYLELPFFLKNHRQDDG